MRIRVTKYRYLFRKITSLDNKKNQKETLTIKFHNFHLKSINYHTNSLTLFVMFAHISIQFCGLCKFDYFYK